MTVNELVEQLQCLNTGGTEPVVVSAFGGMRTGKAVTGASLGFDWDHGSVVLSTDPKLTVYEEPRQTELGELRRLVSELRSLVEIAPVRKAKRHQKWWDRRAKVVADSSYERLLELRTAPPIRGPP